MCSYYFFCLESDSQNVVSAQKASHRFFEVLGYFTHVRFYILGTLW